MGGEHRPNANVKLVLSGEALERLIGGDSALEVELRNCVVQEFCKKHLKPLVNDENIRRAACDIESSIDQILKRLFEGENPGWGWQQRKVTGLSQGIIDQVKGEVEARVRAAVEQYAVERVQAIVENRCAEWERLINARVDYYMEQGINKLVAERINAAFAAVKNPPEQIKP